jgi:hypothetical protein
VTDDLATWQGRFDHWFPDGAIASWQEEEGPWKPVIYAVPWVEVVAVQGNSPVILMRPYGTDRVVGPYVVVEHEILRLKPHLLLMATFENVVNHMLLTAGMDESKAAAMAPARAYQQANPFPPDALEGVNTDERARVGG